MVPARLLVARRVVLAVTAVVFAGIAVGSLVAPHAMAEPLGLGLTNTSALNEFSAFLLNDTVVLMMTPLVVETTLAAGLAPLPHLVGLAVAANVGSVATLVGNPQNMLIGISSGIGFVDFTGALAPVAIGGMVLAWATLCVVYRRELTTPAAPPPAGGVVPTPSRGPSPTVASPR